MVYTDEERFDAVLKKMRELYKKKNTDYGCSFQSLYDKIGMAYAVGHIAEKAERLVSLQKNGRSQIKDESIKDSLIDCANYCVMTLMEMTRFDDIIENY